MSKLEKRVLLGVAGVTLGGLLIGLSYLDLSIGWFESLTVEGATSGVLFWSGALLAAVAVGGWEVLLVPMRFLAMAGVGRYGSKYARHMIKEGGFLFESGERFEVNEDYFERIGREPAHPKYRRAKPHKTLDDIPDYKQQIELPNYAEQAKNSPYDEPDPESPEGRNAGSKQE